jgi:NitT/TauT family transport system permease protein
VRDVSVQVEQPGKAPATGTPTPSRTQRPPRGLSMTRRLGRTVSYIAVPLAGLVVWQLVVSLFSVGPFLPAPTDVAKAWWDWLTGSTGDAAIYSGKLLSAIGASAARILIGYAIAVAAAVPIGIFVGWSPFMRRLLEPILQFLRPVPVTAWVPISILWFGIGARAAVFLIFLAAFFPVFLNTTQGVRYVDRSLIRAGQMLGATGRNLLTHVVLPASLPSIFVGLRVGLGFAWMAVVVSELVAVKNGIGYVMFDAYGFLRADIVIAAMVTVGLLGYVTDRLMLLLEGWALRWTK